MLYGLTNTISGCRITSPILNGSCRCQWMWKRPASMWRRSAVPQFAWFLSLWVPDGLPVWLIQEDVCRYVKHLMCYLKRNTWKNAKHEFTFLAWLFFIFPFILFCSLQSPFYFISFTFMLPTFFCLRSAHPVYYSVVERAAAVFQSLLPASAVATRLLITSPAPPVVPSASDSLRCVVTLIIMNSA